MKYGVQAMVACGLVLAAQAAAQEQKPTAAQCAAIRHATIERTFVLKNERTQADQNEVLTAVRNLVDPAARIFLVPGASAIAVEAAPEQMDLIEKLLRDLDVPRKTYRLTYTVTDTEGGKRVGVQHFSLVVAAGQRTQVKQGNRVPLVTGTQGEAAAAGSKQITYIDVGVSIEATVDPLENAVGLRTRVESSSVAGELSSTLSEDPVIRQTTVEGTSVVGLGKALELESLDVPGSTRHTQVEVVAELVK